MGVYSVVIYFGTIIGIYTVLSLSLNFQYGFAGLINFGQVGFFAVGAYASAILTTSAGMPIAVGFLGAIAAGALAGFLVALPTQKVSIHYWALTTMAIAEIIRLVALNEEWLTRGSFGILNIPRPFESMVPNEHYPLVFMLFCWVIVGAVALLIHLLVNSPYGRVLKVLREEEDLALSFGKPVFRYRVSAMALGAGMAGLGGALYAHYITYISPVDFMPLITFVVWVMVIVGGRANQTGVILGSVVIIVFFNSTRFLKDLVPLEAHTIASLRMVVIGLLIMLAVLYRPGGLLPERKKVLP